MDKATLHGITGEGELSVTHTTEGTIVKGLWYSVGTEGLNEVIEAHAKQETVTYQGYVRNAQYPDHSLHEIKVKIRSVETAVNPETGDVQLTASIYALGFPTYTEA